MPAASRLLEGARLQVADVDSARMVVHVHGKGKQDRYVPLPAPILPGLRAYWQTHRSREWMFPAPTRRGLAHSLAHVDRADARELSGPRAGVVADLSGEDLCRPPPRRLTRPGAPAIWTTPGVVHCQHAGRGQKVLDYLGRYIFRVAIANSSLERIQDD